MALTTGTTVNIGPKGSNNRAHRITHIEAIHPTGRGNRKVTLVRINDGTTWTTTIKPTAKRIAWNARMNRVITDAEREQSIEQEALKIIHHEGEIDSTRINHSTLYRLSAKGLVYVSRHYPNGAYDVALTTHGRDLIDTDHTDNSAQESDTITVGDIAHEYDITIQETTTALGDDTLTEDDGVDADMARDILNQQNSLNISDRVQWNDGDHPVNFVREGEIFEFIPGGFVQVNYRDGTAHRSRTIHRDRLTKINRTT